LQAAAQTILHFYTSLHSVVCLSVCRNRAPCLNRSTYFDTMRQLHRCGPMTHCAKLGSQRRGDLGQIVAKPSVLYASTWRIERKRFRYCQTLVLVRARLYSSKILFRYVNVLEYVRLYEVPVCYRPTSNLRWPVSARVHSIFVPIQLSILPSAGTPVVQSCSSSSR